MDRIMWRGTNVEGSGDVGVRRVHRGENAEFESNAEYSLVFPEIDKMAVIALAVIEVAAVLTASPVWSTELHFVTIAAIAGLGGYNMAGRQRVDEEVIRDRQHRRSSEQQDPDEPQA